MKISLTQPTSGYNLAAINDNFAKLQDEFQSKVLYRNNPVGEPNTMEVDLDMNGKSIYNVKEITVGGINISGLNSALVWRGTWSSATTYAKNDAVYYLGSSYICLVANTNFTPSGNPAKWDVLAAQGAAGAGTGDVVGPDSATTNNVVTFNGGTGKLVKDSGIPIATVLQTSNIGTTVQGYDATIAKTGASQTFTAPQKADMLTDNDGSFDLSAKNHFKCTPTGLFTLTFTNIPASVAQSGFIVLVNTGGYAVSKAASVKASANFLSNISVAGTYTIGYVTDGTNVYVSATGAQS